MSFTDQSAIQNRNGVLFFFSLNCVFNSIQSLILLFPDERPVFLREQASGMYGVTAYYFAKISSEIPLFVMLPTLLSLITYFALGLNITDSGEHFFMFVFIAISLYIAGGGMGLLIGSAVSNK